MTHHIIYKTTCLPTGKFYVGMHSSKKPTDKYLGSGLIIANSVKKYGKEQHIRETLATAESRDALRELERQTVTEELLQDPMCMNLAIGGSGSGYGRKVSDASRKKMSDVRKGWAHMAPEARDRRRAELAQTQRDRHGELHPRAKTWILLSPENEIIRTKAMNDFCKERGLNYFSLRNRANFNDLRPITRGDSAGWSVLSCKHAEEEVLLD